VETKTIVIKIKSIH